MMMMDLPLLANWLGFLALISYIVTLLPTILKIVFPATKGTEIPQVLLKQRRLIGILAFFFSVGHGILFINKRNIDWFDLKTFLVYFQGLSTFTIFAILTATSNNWSIKKLNKNWKEVHKLTYFAMFLLTWHIWQKMSGHWTYITPIGIVLISGVTILFIIRLGIEYRLKQQKTVNQPQKIAQETEELIKN
ncbi:MAG: ferric reductase-like transmembrane domain-containing protein [Planktothrix sp.]|uniref:ferric reductase-like transmembrane domain-containing protein n=1 Tax=Planktothrix sp. TaxID=3088171 RepID=UPI0038D42FBF